MKICSKKYILTCENQVDLIIHIFGIVLEQINWTGRRPLLSVLDIPVHALIRCMRRVQGLNSNLQFDNPESSLTYSALNIKLSSSSFQVNVKIMVFVQACKFFMNILL